MPVRVRKVGKKFAVVDSSGKRHGIHSTKKKAVKHVQAMNLSLLRVKGKRG